MKIKKTFPVVGMSCASCAARIDKVIHEQPGVYEANINYATAQARSSTIRRSVLFRP